MNRTHCFARIGQLWPDQVPVIGPKIAASYCAVGGALYCQAVLYRHWPSTNAPLLNDGWGNVNGFGKCRLRSNLLARHLDRFLIVHTKTAASLKQKHKHC